MNARTSSDQIDSFDPAIHLHSARPDDNQDHSHTDEIQGFNEHLDEVKAYKTELGIVIQHRAWRTGEIFLSEGNPAHSPSAGRHVKCAGAGRLSRLPWNEEGPPSSPPAIDMPYLSSPTAYPPTSPAATKHDENARKRKRDHGKARAALGALSSNARVGAFVFEDSDDEPDMRSTKQAPAKESSMPISQVVHDDYRAFRDINEHIRLVTAAGMPSKKLMNQPCVLEADSSDGTSLRTCEGITIRIRERVRNPVVSYEQLIAARSDSVEGHARRSYYGVDIHHLMDENIAIDNSARLRSNAPTDVQPSIEPMKSLNRAKNTTLLWTEKYRARKFTDLMGDERTHRSVLRWLKTWDRIVFPGIARPKQKPIKEGHQVQEDYPHRKILILAGPPGLGKTTLAHVCARQAGYEVQEINASDERSGNVVRGRIKDMVGTENVRGVEIRSNTNGGQRKAGKPVCLIVDEVDGVVTGSGGSGEGGFVKALIDLVHMDQRNSANKSGALPDSSTKAKHKKGEGFRILRPLVLICNDVYHPSLRPLRQSGFAEIIYVRKPPFNMVVSRMHSIFEKEGVLSDMDAVRRLCEATWGISNRKGFQTATGTAEGDIRSVLVLAEWVATKIHAAASRRLNLRLSRNWLDEHILGDLSAGGGAARCLGRGGARDVVDRVFQAGAGFPVMTAKALQQEQEKEGRSGALGVVGVTEAEKRRAMARLREMVNAVGDSDRIVTDCFTMYPNQPIQDDTFLSKPCAAYDWLHFHDQLNHQLLSGQEWELAPYLSSPVLAFHHLFASSNSARAAYESGRSNASGATGKGGNTKSGDSEEAEPSLPFSGPSAPFAANEALKANTSAIQSLQAGLSLPLARMYGSTTDIATELLPYTLRMLSPDVKPVIVNTSSNSSANSSNSSRSVATASVRKASEKALVARSVQCMAATGVRFERTRFEHLDQRNANGMAARNSVGFVYRMEPALDALSDFETFTAAKVPNLKREGSSTASMSTNPGGLAHGQSGAVRYAVRQVLEQEWKKESARIEEEARRRRAKGLSAAGSPDHPDLTTSSLEAAGSNEQASNDASTSNVELDISAALRKAPKRDFFGRVIVPSLSTESSSVGMQGRNGSVSGPGKSHAVAAEDDDDTDRRTWVTFHEGFSNAVRKPITLEEFMRGV